MSSGCTIRLLIDSLDRGSASVACTQRECPTSVPSVRKWALCSLSPWDERAACPRGRAFHYHGLESGQCGQYTSQCDAIPASGIRISFNEDTLSKSRCSYKSTRNENITLIRTQSTVSATQGSVQTTKNTVSNHDILCGPNSSRDRGEIQDQRDVIDSCTCSLSLDCISLSSCALTIHVWLQHFFSSMTMLMKPVILPFTPLLRAL